MPEPGCLLGHASPCKRGPDIAIGDVLLPFGEPHLVAVIEPYDGPLDGIIGVARGSDGWGISLSKLVCVEVAHSGSSGGPDA